MGGFTGAAGSREQIGLAVVLDGRTVEEEHVVGGKLLTDGAVNANKFPIGHAVRGSRLSAIHLGLYFLVTDENVK